MSAAGETGLPTYATMSWVLVVAAVVAVGLTSLTVLTLRGVRMVRGRRDRARDERVRPLVMEVLDGAPVRPTSRADRRHLVGLVVTMSHAVRGEDRAVLATWLRGAGAVHESRRLMRSVSAVRRAHGVTLYLPLADADPTPIEALLDDRHRNVRLMAAGALGRSASITSLPTLLRRTGEGRHDIPTAVTAMAVLRMSPRTAAPLVAELPAASDSTRPLLLEVIGTLNLLDGRRALEEHLTSPHEASRVAALGALGRLGVPMSLAVVRQHVASTEPESHARTRALALLDDVA